MYLLFALFANLIRKLSDGSLRGIDLVEYFDHVDDFHYYSSVLGKAAVNCISVLYLDVFAGLEGKGGNAGDGHCQCDILALDPAFEQEVLAV